MLQRCRARRAGGALVRGLTLAGVLLGLLGVAVGCGGGHDEEEARAICDSLVTNVDTSGEAAYEDCVACHMECGDDCAVLESFPPQFACPE